jgi:hypothetical protein
MLCKRTRLPLLAMFITGSLCQSALLAERQPSAPDRQYDIVVYGGTSAGVIAAVQAARMGKSVVLVEPGRHLGGLTSGGLGATDIGNKAAIGGLSRDFYRRIKAHYDRDDAWVHETRDEHFASGSRNRGGEDALWTFEPHVAEQVYRDWLKEANVPVLFEERLDLKSGVSKDGARITEIRMESGRALRARVYVDATYEGDLMAHAGVSYHVGRESNSEYGETLNGVQVRNATKHQFLKPVDPYVKPGDPSSGLLPGVVAGPPAPDGTGDKKVQAYCFRMCTTDVPGNQVEWVKPAKYDPLRYELLLRNFEAGDHRVPWNPIGMPNRKTDTNNNFAFSTDNIGMNYDYPDGDYATRDRIFQEHLTYQQGLMWTLANSPRVPAEVRHHFQRLKPARDEFTDHGHWPHQLYVREARRMVSDYVMTQHNCQGRDTAADSVGLAAYGMDSHNIQRYVDAAGHARNEGDIQVHGFSPYPIAYRSIRPRKGKCTNLLVPVCVSSTHIAYGSIRMEPVFMVLGQSAATAACHAIDEHAAVQDIDFSRLKSRLLADGQVLEWTGPKRRPPLDPAQLDGIVVDDSDAQLAGEWQSSRSVEGFVGQQYLHDGNTSRGELTAVFQPNLPRAGRYEVRLAYTPNPNRATNVLIAIETADGQRSLTVNQREAPQDPPFESLGTFRFKAGETGRVTITNTDADGYVIIDAVQWLPARE